MLIYSAPSAAPAPEAWELMSQPELWHRWAPHLRGAWGLGSPEVLDGRVGVALVAGVIPTPVLVTSKQPGHSWRWRAGLLSVDHAVEATELGCVITISLSAPWPLESVLHVSYGAVTSLLVKRLARVAERTASGAASGI